jgi:hypothetical protein
MRSLRRTIPSDLAPLKDLYFHLNRDRPVLAAEAAEPIFERILTSPDCHLFVCQPGGALVASCMLATVPNLMRGGRPPVL